MQYHEFLARMADNGGPPEAEHAHQATTATLELLGQRLAGGEPSDLAAQLPAEMKTPLTKHVGAAETYDVDEFLRRLADQEGRGCAPEQARAHARAVLYHPSHLRVPGRTRRPEIPTARRLQPAFQ